MSVTITCRRGSLTAPLGNAKPNLGARAQATQLPVLTRIAGTKELQPAGFAWGTYDADTHTDRVVVPKPSECLVDVAWTVYAWDGTAYQGHIPESPPNDEIDFWDLASIYGWILVANGTPQPTHPLITPALTNYIGGGYADQDAPGGAAPVFLTKRSLGMASTADVTGIPTLDDQAHVTLSQIRGLDAPNFAPQAPHAILIGPAAGTTPGAVTARALVSDDIPLLHDTNIADDANISASKLNVSARLNSAGAALDLASGIVSPGTYAYPTAVVADTYGRITSVTSGSQPATAANATAPLHLSLSAGAISGSIDIATPLAVGVVQLAGDLAGIATAPTVVHLGNVTDKSLGTDGIADSAVTAVKLAVTSPTAAEFGGLHDANIAADAAIAGSKLHVSPAFDNSGAALDLASIIGSPGASAYPSSVTIDAYGRVTGITPGSQPATSAAGAGPLHLTLSAGALTGSIDNASPTALGVVQLAGDLGGSPTSPTVPALAGKAAIRSVGPTLTAAATLTANVHTPADASAGGFTLALPTGQPSGAVISVEKIDATANPVTVSGNIRGLPGQSAALTLSREAFVLMADASGSWWPWAGHKTLASLDARYVQPGGDIGNTTVAPWVTNLSHVTNGSLPASGIAAVNPSSLTGSGTVPLPALAGITHSQLDPAAGIVDAQIAGLAASKLTGLTNAGDLLVGGTPVGGVAPPVRLGLPSYANQVPAWFSQTYPAMLVAGTPGTGTQGPQAGGPGYLAGKDHVNILDFGAVADCTSASLSAGNTRPSGSGASGLATDNTAAVQAAVNAVCAAGTGGGAIFVPPAGNSFYIGGQIVIPQTSGRKSNVVVLYGVPGNTGQQGSGLVFGYRSPGIDKQKPADAKIVARGSGMLIVRDLSLAVALADYSQAANNLDYPDADYTPFFLGTNAIIQLQSLQVNGSGLALIGSTTGVTYPAWFYSGTAPHTDLLVAGDPNDSLVPAGDGGFLGYATHIKDCHIASIRRVAYGRGNGANSLYIHNNQIDDGAGNADTTFGPLIDFEGYGCSATDNSLTLTVGGSGFRLAGGGYEIAGDPIWDERLSLTNSSVTPPATWATIPGSSAATPLTLAAAAGATTIATAGYIPSSPGMVAGGQSVVIESTPLVSLNTALTSASNTPVVAVVTGGGQASDAGVLTGGLMARNAYIRMWDLDAAGRPDTKRQEIMRVGSVSGTGPYTLTGADTSDFLTNSHPAGTIVQLYPTVVVQPLAQGQTAVAVNNLCGGLIRVGSWVKLVDVMRTSLQLTTLLEGGYSEWFRIAAVNGQTGAGPYTPNALGTYTLTVDHPAIIGHTSMTTSGRAIAGVTIAAGSQTGTTNTVTVSSAIDLLAGTPISINGQTANIQAIAGAALTLDAALTGIAVGQAVTAYIPTTIVEVWEQATIGTGGQPTAAAVFRASSYLNQRMTSVSLINGAPNPSIPAGLPAGTQVAIQVTGAAAPGANIQVASETQATSGVEYAYLQAVDYGKAVFTFDRAPIQGHGASFTNYVVGPYTNSCAPLGQNHWSSHRILANTAQMPMFVPRYADLPYLYLNGSGEAERFVVVGYAPQNAASQQTTLAGAPPAGKYPHGTLTYTVANASLAGLVPNAWVVIGPTNPDGSFVYGKAEVVQIASVNTAASQITIAPPAGTLTAGSFFPHWTGESVCLGPFTVTTSPLARYFSGGSFPVGLPFVEEPQSSGNYIDIGTTIPRLAGVSFSREMELVNPAGSSGSSFIRQGIGAALNSAPGLTYFSKGLILPSFVGPPNRQSITTIAQTQQPLTGWLAFDALNGTATIENTGPQALANTRGYPVAMSGISGLPSLSISHPTTSANYPMLHVGTGAADGTTSGTYAGPAGGTVIGSNMPSTFAGDFLVFGTNVGGVFTKRWEVDSTGTLVTGSVPIARLTGSSMTLSGTSGPVYIGNITSGAATVFAAQAAGTTNWSATSAGVTSQNGAATALNFIASLTGVQGTQTPAALSATATPFQIYSYTTPVSVGDLAVTPGSSIQQVAFQFAAPTGANMTLGSAVIYLKLDSTNRPALTDTANVTIVNDNGGQPTGSTVRAGTAVAMAPLTTTGYTALYISLGQVATLTAGGTYWAVISFPALTAGTTVHVEFDQAAATGTSVMTYNGSTWTAAPGASPKGVFQLQQVTNAPFNLTAKGETFAVSLTAQVAAGISITNTSAPLLSGTTQSGTGISATSVTGAGAILTSTTNFALQAIQSGASMLSGYPSASAAVQIIRQSAPGFVGSTFSGTMLEVRDTLSTAYSSGLLMTLRKNGIDMITVSQDGNVTGNQISAPSAPAVALAAGGSLADGVAVKYLVTFVNANGETTSGTASAALTPTVASGNQTVNLSAIPLGLGGTTQRKIYRSDDGGSTYGLTGTIADNVTTTFTDTGLAKGAAPPTLNTTGGKWTFYNTLTLQDGVNFALQTGTGTKIGTSATQKLGFFNATPIVQPGSTTDLRTALINLGLLATGGATPLNLNGGALTTGSLSIADGGALSIGTTTGTQIGQSTSKLAFFGNAAIARPTMTVDTALAAVTDANAKSVLTAIIAALTDKAGGLGLVHEA